jgi:hypothetical protein
MKTHSALVLVGLAISFVVPTFAQQEDTANPRIAQQRDLVGDPTALDEFGLLATQQSEAFTNKDAPAVAALFTADAVLVAPDGIFPVGRRLRRGMKTRSSSGLLRFLTTCVTDTSKQSTTRSGPLENGGHSSRPDWSRVR